MGEEQVEELNHETQLSTRKKGGLVTMPFIIGKLTTFLNLNLETFCNFTSWVSRILKIF